jgi:hypothetical protein
MKVNLFLILCLLSSEAFPQVAIQNPGYVVGPHLESLDWLTKSNRSGGAIDYNHYDLNSNSYSGGDRDIAEIDAVLPVSEKYSFENFTNGNLIFSSGNQSQVVKMNYNLLYREMQFINEKGDTLFILNSDSIAFVRFEKNLYLHTPQGDYFKIISGSNNLQLCSLQKLNLNKGYKTSNLNVSVPAEYLVLSTKEYYYLINKGKGVKYEANKDGFQRAFPKYEQQIEGYLRQMARQKTPIKFTKEDDLIVLLEFCNSLQ